MTAVLQARQSGREMENVVGFDRDRGKSRGLDFHTRTAYLP